VSGETPTFATADEFEAWYAANAKVSVEQLRAGGRLPVACDCGDAICTGWAMDRRAQ
jgi:hypothetical protein